MKDKKPLLWIPVYIDKYLFGSTRIELKPDERSVWMDLLVLAGKDSGYVRANEGVPYLITQLSGMLVIPEELLKRTIEKCLQYGKIKVLKDNTIFIQNWEKYKLSPRHKRRFGSMSAKTDTMSPKEDAIVIDKDKVNKSKVNKSKKEKPEYISLAKLLGELILKRSPNDYYILKAQKNGWINWANNIRLMVEQDKCSLEEIKKVIKWCQEDDFWKTNIRSTSKLRLQFGQLEERMNKKPKESKWF